MRISTIGALYERLGDNETRIWKLLAYAGRYGHQSVRDMQQLTARELRRLVTQLNVIVQEENGAVQSAGGED